MRLLRSIHLKNPRDARRFLKQTLKQLQDEVECKEDNTLLDPHNIAT